MKTLELFSGTQSFSKVMRKQGHSTYCIDNNVKFNNDLTIDILDFQYPFEQLDNIDFDIIWASPPCTTFSVASISTHWTGGKGAYIPKSENSKIGLKILEHTIKQIAVLNPKYWYIENPRGVMRKVIEPIFKKYGLEFVRHTLTYCQYGENRMKPTDIWTNNFNWKPKPMCKNGSPCHESAPRGSKTGTQGLKNDIERSRIPSELFEEILRFSF